MYITRVHACGSDDRSTEVRTVQSMEFRRRAPLRLHTRGACLVRFAAKPTLQKPSAQVRTSVSMLNECHVHGKLHAITAVHMCGALSPGTHLVIKAGRPAANHDTKPGHAARRSDNARKCYKHLPVPMSYFLHLSTTMRARVTFQRTAA